MRGTRGGAYPRFTVGHTLAGEGLENRGEGVEEMYPSTFLGWAPSSHQKSQERRLSSRSY
jgi:hypothetical protein